MNGRWGGAGIDLLLQKLLREIFHYIPQEEAGEAGGKDLE